MFNKKKKEIDKICGNCMLYDNERKQCKVAVLVEGVEYHMPVSPKDSCHMDELGIPVQQVRWWEEDNKVKIEYPENFFGKERT